MSEPAAQSVIAVVVPCYREKRHILEVLAGIGDDVSHVVVVDDACPDGTGAYVRETCTDPRVVVEVHAENQGVGGATLTGYRRAVDLGAEVIVKLDGDGQMDPALVTHIAGPVLRGEADYSKGNRFYELDTVRAMPRLRILGNLGLSFLSKLSSGYWDLFDPTNGFTAIHARAVERLPLDKIDRGYFFESDILFRLYLLRAVVVDVPMEARYGSEVSHLKVGRALVEFALKHYRNTFKRIVYTYYLRDFNIASIELLLAKPLILFGIAYGGYRWWESETTGVPATAGTVILAALPVILGSQMALAFLDFDARNVPKKVIQKRLRSPRDERSLTGCRDRP